MKDLTRHFVYIIVAIILVFISFVFIDELIDWPGLLFLLLSAIVFDIALCYLADFFAAMFIRKEYSQELFLTIAAFGWAVFSFIVGIIVYINDHSFILRGLESQLIWFLISIPELVMGIGRLIIHVVKLRKDKA